MKIDRIGLCRQFFAVLLRNPKDEMLRELSFGAI